MNKFASMCALGYAIVFIAFAVNGAAQSHEEDIKGWGRAIDPDGDCKISLNNDGTLEINIPGTGKPYDLAAEIGTINAPRVLQSASGDFTLRVKTESVAPPGGESTKPGRTGYNGAAIIAMLDDGNVVTLARAALQRPGKEAVPYVNFEIRIDGKLERIGLTGDLPVPKDGPLHLQLERRGQLIHGSASTDGVDWKYLNSKEIPPHWENGLKVGVAAISTSKEAFIPKFSGLQLLK